MEPRNPVNIVNIVCLWCNGVIEWGDRGIEYDLCDRCVPGVLRAIERQLEEDEPVYIPAGPAVVPLRAVR